MLSTTDWMPAGWLWGLLALWIASVAVSLIYWVYLYLGGIRERLGTDAPKWSFNYYESWRAQRFLFSRGHKKLGDPIFSALTWTQRILILAFAAWLLTGLVGPSALRIISNR